MCIIFKKSSTIYTYICITSVPGLELTLNGGYNMEITDIRIRQMTHDEKMKAVVSVTFDNCFVVHDIKIIDGQDRLFIAMPSRKTPDNEYKDIAHPINMETRELLQSRILEKYQSTLLEEENS